jgi:hypothetical protein
MSKELDYEKEITKLVKETYPHGSEGGHDDSFRLGAEQALWQIHLPVRKEAEQRINDLEEGCCRANNSFTNTFHLWEDAKLEVERLRKKLKDVEPIVSGIVYRNLAGLYQENKMSIPCKSRTEVEQKIVTEIIKALHTNPKD